MDTVRANVVVHVRDDDNTWIHQSEKSLEDIDGLVQRLKKRVEETKWQGHHWTIYRVPSCLRMVDPTAYEPRILSLGPYHYGKSHLRAIDELKWCYLKNFLRRNPERGLKDYLNLMAAMEAQTRKAYAEAPRMDSEHWVEMMLLDSCFVVELLLKLNSKHEESHDAAVDPILSTLWMCPSMQRDMLLLENQLPFFLLEKLLELNSLSSAKCCSLVEITLEVFKHLIPGMVGELSLNNIGDIHHILHLFYSCTLPTNTTTGGLHSHGLARRFWSFCIHPLLRKFTRNSINCYTSNATSRLQRIPSAKNLKDAGVVFRKKTKNVTSFMDITFRKGTLEIPPLEIFDESNSLFRNLIAFEQAKMGDKCSTHLAYAYLMDCIIDTPADVDLLQQEGIITCAMGNDDEVARVFNRLGTNAVMQPTNYLSGVFDDVQRYCSKTRNKWKATLKHNYFNNPWAIVSVIAAIFLFLLTMTQTVLAFFSYLQPRSP